MAGTFFLGETKIRPGTYYNIQKKGGNSIVGATNGITAVFFKADFGPLCKAVEIGKNDGYESIFGTALTTDAISNAFAGGATKVIACRLGTGGKASSVELKDVAGTKTLLKITALYPGAKEFSVTVREKLTEPGKKECIIFSGTKEFEKATFEKGGNESGAIVKAFSSSKTFVFSELADGELKDVTQSPFTGGENPATTVADYSDAFSEAEKYYFNTACVDTIDPKVHVLLQTFLNRIFEVGQLSTGVVAQDSTTDLEERMTNAAGYNDNKMHYVLNPSLDVYGETIDGYQTACRIAGMIAASEANSSLTHTVLSGVTGLNENLTNTQIEKAETMGCLVLSVNSSGQVWIDSAINTLITPNTNQDEGWKKIRRTKARFELIRRLNITSDAYIGKIDNDNNGRSTLIAQLQATADSMAEENKITSCTITESETYKADGDSAWFDLDVVDKDSLEHIYLLYRFRFSTVEEE